MLQTEDIFYKTFVPNTYSCIKGRGIHKASSDLRKALKDRQGTKYCLKIDIVKFYPNIDNDILKSMLRRKFKDEKLLRLLDEIIDSNKGLPLGNITSQFLANYYLTWFDHWMKETIRVKYTFRYADDLVVLHHSKEQLWNWLEEIRVYLRENLKLEIKSNYQIFPVESRGVDWVGYKHFHTHTLLRKSIKKRFIKATKKESLASYFGWLKWCNSKNLRNKYEQKFILEDTDNSINGSIITRK